MSGSALRIIGGKKEQNMSVPWVTEIAGPGFEMEIGPVYRMLEDGATYAPDTEVQIVGVSLVMEKELCRLAVKIALSCHSWKEVITVGVTSPRHDVPPCLSDRQYFDTESEEKKRNTLTAPED
jgi:hypothetical protein